MRTQPLLLVATGALAMCMSAIAMPVPGGQYPERPTKQEPAPDNTGRNRDRASPTADQQKNNSSDLEITRKIRKATTDDKSLSTYAHNAKIITQNGRVTLRGPVKSEQEKAALEAKAAAVVGADNVVNELEIAPAK